MRTINRAGPLQTIKTSHRNLIFIIETNRGLNEISTRFKNTYIRNGKLIRYRCPLTIHYSIKQLTKKIMKIKDVMIADSLKFCNPETQLHNAAEMMRSSNCGALPVVDKNKKVVGMITDRDIALSLSKRTTSSPFDMPVEKVMTKKIHTVMPSDDISAAYQQMRSNKIGRLPVVDEKGSLKGMVSLHRLLHQTLSQGKKEQLGEISSSEENILKTVYAITGRYSGKMTEHEPAEEE
jgi:predicted transcriptional regulator